MLTVISSEVYPISVRLLKIVKNSRKYLRNQLLLAIIAQIIIILIMVFLIWLNRAATTIAITIILVRAVITVLQLSGKCIRNLFNKLP